MNYTVIDTPTAKQPRKSNWRPTHQEGLYIQYRLGLQGITLRAVADRYSVSKAAVSAVTAGHSRSRRIEAEVARVLGKESWEDVVIEARLAVSDPAYTPSAETIAAYKRAYTACEIPELPADQNAGDTEALTSDSDMLQLRELLSTISLTRKDIEPFEEEMALYIFRLLYKTRAVLTDPKWQRKDPAAANYLPFSWHGYCQWIGVSRKTMEALLNYFTPAELSEDGKDHIRIDAVRKAFWGTLVWSFCILENNAVCILHHASRRTGLVPECEQDEEE